MLPAVSVPNAPAHKPALTETAEPLLLPDGSPLATYAELYRAIIDKFQMRQ